MTGTAVQAAAPVVGIAGLIGLSAALALLVSTTLAVALVRTSGPLRPPAPRHTTSS